MDNNKKYRAILFHHLDGIVLIPTLKGLIETKIIYNIFNMDEKYLYIYNNLINYTRNKDLYKNLNREDLWNDIFPILNKRIKF